MRCFCGVVWCVLFCSVVVRCGVWCGVVRCGVVWCGVGAVGAVCAVVWCGVHPTLCVVAYSLKQKLTQTDNVYYLIFNAMS